MFSVLLLLELLGTTTKSESQGLLLQTFAVCLSVVVCVCHSPVFKKKAENIQRGTWRLSVCVVVGILSVKILLLNLK